jgi:hypothetical protein
MTCPSKHRRFPISPFLPPAATISVLQAAQPSDESLRKATLANINAVLVFTIQTGLNSADYSFDKKNTRFQTYHFSGVYDFKPFAGHFDFLFGGGVGYSQTTLISEQNQTTPS